MIAGEYFYMVSGRYSDFFHLLRNFSICGESHGKPADGDTIELEGWN
jgi:hypothetical protein